jgi:protein TonB
MEGIQGSFLGTSPIIYPVLVGSISVVTFLLTSLWTSRASGLRQTALTGAMPTPQGEGEISERVLSAEAVFEAPLAGPRLWRSFIYREIEEQQIILLPDARPREAPQTDEFDQDVPFEYSPNFTVSQSLLTDLFDWKDARLFVLASAFVHICLLSALISVSRVDSAGAAGLGGDAIVVRLLEEENLVPEEESPGSVDSAASSPSIAERRREDSQSHSRAASHQPPAVELSAEEGRLAGKEEQRLKDEKKTELPDTSADPEEAEKKSAFKDKVTVVSESRADSPASMPSFASPERRLVAAAGKEVADFKAKLLSAIEEASYFPRKALNKRHHGRAVVTFSLARDGSISMPAITEHSGSDILDQAAVTIIRKAATNFPPLPLGITSESVTYSVPIIFKEPPGTDQ